MKVSELIEKLKTFPSDSQILIMTEKHFYENINIFPDALNLYAILDVENNHVDCNEGDDSDNF